MARIIGPLQKEGPTMFRMPSFAIVPFGFSKSRGARRSTIDSCAAQTPRPRWADAIRDARERIRSKAKRPFPWPYY
jgi:hypothetical protein